MLMNNFKLDHNIVTDEEYKSIHCITLSSEVIIKRDKKTHAVPFTQIYEYPTKDYNVQTLEEAILGYILHAERISKKWQIVVEDEISLEGGGRVLTQRDFDITRDIL